MRAFLLSAIALAMIVAAVVLAYQTGAVWVPLLLLVIANRWKPKPPLPSDVMWARFAALARVKP